MRVDTSRVPVGRLSASSRGRSHIGESGVNKSVDADSSGDDDWESGSAIGSASLTSRSRPRSVSVCASVSVIVGATGRGWGTMGSEGGGERGRCWMEGCDVRGLSEGCVSVVEGEEGSRVEERWQADESATCDGESSHRGSGTVCLGSESVGGGDG